MTAFYLDLMTQTFPLKLCLGIGASSAYAIMAEGLKRSASTTAPLLVKLFVSVWMSERVVKGSYHCFVIHGQWVEVGLRQPWTDHSRSSPSTVRSYSPTSALYC